MTTVLNTLEQLNAQIQVYNTTSELKIKNEIRVMIIDTTSRVLAGDIQRIPKVLEKVIAKTDEFLSKYD